MNDVPPSRSPTLGECVKTATGAVAALGAAFYLIGYLALNNHVRLLGVPGVSLTADRIVNVGGAFVPCSLSACVLAAVLTPIGRTFIIGGLLAFLTPRKHWLKLKMVVLRWGSCPSPLGGQTGLHWRTLRSTLRLLKHIVLFLPLLAVIVLSVVSLSASSPILDTEGILLDDAEKPVLSGTFAAIVACPSGLTHRWILCERNEALSLGKPAPVAWRCYGVFCLLFIVSMGALVFLGWLRVPDWKRKGPSSITHRFSWLFLAVASLLVFVQFLSLPALYGRLIVSDTYPTISLTNEDSHLCGTTACFIGMDGKRAVIYSHTETRLYWVSEDTLIPSSHVSRRAIFLKKASQ